MKRILLALLVACPAMVVADDTSIAQTWRNISSYRAVSGVKAVLQGLMAGYAGYRSLTTVGDCADSIKVLLTTQRNRKQLELALDRSVLTGGMAYTSYLLACYAWQNAKHALAIK